MQVKCFLHNQTDENENEERKDSERVKSKGKSKRKGKERERDRICKIASTNTQLNIFRMSVLIIGKNIL